MRAADDLARGVVQALLAALDDPELAARVAERLEPHLSAPATGDQDRWMGTAEAARYLGLTVNAVHRLMSDGRLPRHQEVAGGKCWFKRSELDSWRDDGAR